jgi:serine/threonine-protein kinase
MTNQPTLDREDSKPDISVVESLPDSESAIKHAPLMGERFGKYLLVGELAAGGMAEVLLAVRKGLEEVLKVVALKRMLPHLSSSAELTQMFINEARLASRLEHPNIVRTYEFDEHAGRYFTVMEYLAGEDLGKVLNRFTVSRQHMPIELATSIVSQVCSGLHFAHELTDTEGNLLELVHRDITPSNIIVTFAGEVKLIDFGVAKINTAHTVVGTIKGKVGYMSPEQLRATGVDRRSDVFSTGVVLWELLTGRRLFARDTESATLYAIVNESIPPVRKLRPEVPENLEAIALRALARAPQDRYQTAEDMQMALDHALATLPRAPRSPGAASVDRDTGARALSRTMEQLFGMTRTSAKLSIAQARSLAKNISLVMKARTDVHASLIEQLDHRSDPQRSLEPDAVGAPPWSRLIVGLACLAIVAGAGGGVTYVLSRRAELAPAAAQAAAPATLTITSTPPGAAIVLAGEPTGWTTPATLPSVTAGQLTVRLELAGYQSAETTVTVAPGATVSKQIELASLRAHGRLVLANLPTDSTVVVDGAEHSAGEVVAVDSGRHDVQLIVAGRMVTRRVIETAAGDQTWELHDHQLLPRR